VLYKTLRKFLDSQACNRAAYVLPRQRVHRSIRLSTI